MSDDHVTVDTPFLKVDIECRLAGPALSSEEAEWLNQLASAAQEIGKHLAINHTDPAKTGSVRQGNIKQPPEPELAKVIPFRGRDAK